MMRCNEPGYDEVCKPDGRRGLWMRYTKNSVDLCAGREGDDDYIKLTAGQHLTQEDIAAIVGIVLTLRWSHDLADGDTDGAGLTNVAAVTELLTKLSLDMKTNSIGYGEIEKRIARAVLTLGGEATP